MRVTKKLSKELNKTESGILGALSKLDELLLNPQVRTCSVAVPGTSSNNNSENRETTGDHPSDDPYPEVGYFLHHSGQLESPETGNHPHNSKVFFRSFSDETFVYRRSLIFLYFFSAMMGLWFGTCPWQHCECQSPCLDQPRQQKSWSSEDFEFSARVLQKVHMYVPKTTIRKFNRRV